MPNITLYFRNHQGETKTDLTAVPNTHPQDSSGITHILNCLKFGAININGVLQPNLPIQKEVKAKYKETCTIQGINIPINISQVVMSYLINNISINHWPKYLQINSDSVHYNQDPSAWIIELLSKLTQHRSRVRSLAMALSRQLIENEPRIIETVSRMSQLKILTLACTNLDLRVADCKTPRLDTSIRTNLRFLHSFKNNIGLLLAQQLGLPHLRQLILPENNITDNDCKRFVLLKAMSSLEVLDLGRNRISSSGAVDIFENLTTKITYLDLNSNNIFRKKSFFSPSSSESKLFHHIKRFTHIISLNLSDTNLGDFEFKMLLNSLECPQLQHLNVSHNNIKNITPLTNLIGKFSQLNKVIFTGNRVEPKHIIHLFNYIKETHYKCQCDFIFTRISLSMAANTLQLDGTDRRFNKRTSRLFAKITSGTTPVNITLRLAEISTFELSWLYQALENKTIEKLDLSYNNLDGANVSSLITKLNPKFIDLTDTGVRIYNPICCTKLNALVLSLNNLTDRDISQIFAKKNNIRHLDLSHNNITHIGILTIAKLLPRKQLTSLNISANKIGYNSIAFIAAFLPQSNLIHLNVANNQIGLKGVRALTTTLGLSPLQSLNLTNNGLGSEAIRYLFLSVALHDSKINRLNLSHNHTKYSKKLDRYIMKFLITRKIMFFFDITFTDQKKSAEFYTKLHLVHEYYRVRERIKNFLGPSIEKDKPNAIHKMLNNKNLFDKNLIILIFDFLNQHTSQAFRLMAQSRKECKKKSLPLNRAHARYSLSRSMSMEKPTTEPRGIMKKP